MDNSKSLVVAKKGLLQKIQDFLRKIFKKENEKSQIIEQNEVNEISNKQKFINDLKKSSNSDIKELINKIQNGEVDLDDKNDAELVEIESQLDNYLQYLEQEIKCKKEEINALEVATLKISQ